jgi:mono/diheme cytochrome c family protein
MMRFALWNRALATLLGLSSFALAAAVPPAVPGYTVLKDQAKADLATQGEILLGELNCLQCHAAPDQKQVLTKGAPDLADIGSRITPQFLFSYLLAPHTVRPGTTMPDIFHASEAHAKAGAAEMLTHFLISLGGPMKNEPGSGNALQLAQGKSLYHSVGCVACHAPEKGEKTTVPSVPIDNLAKKTTVDKLTAFLLDPLKTRPHSRMPSSNLNGDEARAIAVYLLREQMDNPQSKNSAPPMANGLRYQYYEANTNSAAIERFTRLKPKSEGRIKTISTKIQGKRNESFALKLAGAISIPKDGKYTFYTRSDDGSRLYIDGYLIVDNDKTHGPEEKAGPVDLKAGDHAIVVTFFQGGGGEELSASWEGPGLKKQEIPSDALKSPGDQAMVPLESMEFTVDKEKAQMGAQMFHVLGCAACHTTLGIQPLRNAKPLANLNLDNEAGCIGTQIEKGRPNYDISDDQRTALKAAIKNAAAMKEPLSPADEVIHTMAAMNCFACHKRGKVGGPEAARTPYFTMTAEFDMGEEGKIPPLLSQPGAKLKPEALEGIIFEGKFHVRPVLATRMPRFNRSVLSFLVDAFVKADLLNGEPPEPKFTETAARDGRTLVGTKGLGCVNCHGVAGVKSLGMPATDLATVHDRLRHGWTHDLLINPATKNPATRMPQFWLDEHGVDVKGVAANTRDTQIDAIWTYLSLGRSMPLPTGLLPTAGYELIPQDEPIIHRDFLDFSNRGIAVGFPENVHVAFDANVVRLAKAWKGKFIDAKGSWDGRGGGHLSPMGTDIITMPAGPSFAILASPQAPWPTAKDRNDRNIGGQFHGYKLDKDGRPTFMYTLDGVSIEEQPLPLLQSGGAQLIRRFHLFAQSAPNNLYFLAATGQKIEQKPDGSWLIDDKLTLKLPPTAKPTLRTSANQKELLLPVTFQNSQWDLQLEMSW